MSDRGSQEAPTVALDEASLRALVDGSPDGILVVDREGSVRFANPAAEAVFGRGLLGSTFGIPVLAADKTEVDVARGDGVDVFELRVVPTSWAGAGAQLVTLRDVTDRVYREEQIARLNAQLQLRAEAASVLTHVGDGVVLVDEDGYVRMLNPAAERLLGTPRAAVEGALAVDVIAGWRRVERTVQAVPTSIEHGPRGQSVVLDVDGEEVWLSVTAVRFSAGTVFAFHDLTEEVRIESLKQDFIATASHELRTPLTSIYGAAHTLRRADVQLDAGARSQLVEVICTQSERLQRLTEDILATSRLQDGMSGAHMMECDPLALAGEVVASVQSQPHEGITFALEDRREAPALLRSDPDKLRQVLFNLVQNAVKYSPDGGLVTVSLVGDGGWTCIDVADQGMGIARADLELVFDKFFRAPGHQRRAIAGTGLGLYIARELLRRVGGDLTVTSRLGEGSTFRVRLPGVSPSPS